MLDIVLHTSTGNSQLDHLLRELIGLCEEALPGSIRTYYLGGSYSDGTAATRDRSPNSSDVDLYVIFCGTRKEDEEARFRRVLAEYQATCPLIIDAQVYSEDDLLRQPGGDTIQMGFMNALIKIAGIPVYGNDIRPALPAVPFQRYVLDVIESGVYHLSIPRAVKGLAYPLLTPLVPPLTYPDPAGEFYGYDMVPSRPKLASGTRVLVGIMAWIATLILALETGRYAAQKSQSIQLCNEYLPDDRRVQLAPTIYNTCKRTWKYALPESAQDRELLRNLCRNTLALENEYLKLCHDYVLAQLQQGGTAEKQQVARILQSIVYQDDEIVTALHTLAHDRNEGVRVAATKALDNAASDGHAII